jgi:hypothetical protein
LLVDEAVAAAIATACTTIVVIVTAVVVGVITIVLATVVRLPLIPHLHPHLLVAVLHIQAGLLGRLPRADSPSDGIKVGGRPIVIDHDLVHVPPDCSQLQQEWQQKLQQQQLQQRLRAP